MVASLFDDPELEEPLLELVPAVVAVEALPDAVLDPVAELPLPALADELPPPVLRPEIGKPAALQSWAKAIYKMKIKDYHFKIFIC